MHVLVIGGTRFVGPLLVFRLLAAGHRVTLFNRGTRADPFGELVERLQGDRTTADLAKAMDGRHFDAAVDFAAYRWDDARGAVAAFGGRVGHYIFISTGQVYLVRDGAPKPARESDYAGALLPRPVLEDDVGQWEYGMGKRECEDALKDAWEKSRFPATSVRIPVVNGERDHYRRLEQYLYRMIDGGPVIVPDGGTHTIRHVYAGEVARFLVEVLGRQETFGEAYNVCQREMPALSEFLGLVANHLGARAKLVPVGWADIKEAGLDPRTLSPFSSLWMSMLDPTKAETELGFRHEPLSIYVGKIVASFCAHARATPPEGYEFRSEEIKLAERWLKERESVRPPPSMRFS